MFENEPISQESQGIGHVSQAAREAIKQSTLGPAMQRLTMKMESAYIALKHSGQLKPATVINFNPIALKLHSQHVPWRIPAGTDANKKGIQVPYGGRTYEAAYFTVREPARVPWITDVKKPAEEENASGEYDAKFILPIELMDAYRVEYTDPGKSGTGGVLVFEGDIHAFEKAFKKKDEGTIRIPRSQRLPDGTKAYYSEEASLLTELAACLDMQKLRCEFMIQQGDEYDQNEQERKNITPVHRAWYRFAMQLGWKVKEARWMSSTMEPEETCKGCGKGVPPTAAFFCDCGRPFNPYAAFMAGENVPESYLFALKDKELADVMKELERREAMRAKFRSKQ